MRVMPTQKVSAISATSEDSSYPANNAIDEHPKKIYKANATNTATLTLTLDSGTSGMAIFNTNALTITASVSDPNSIDWEAGVAWEAGTDFATTDAALSETANLDGVSGVAWWEWDYSENPLEATLTLSAAVGETLQVGVVVADKVYTYNDIKYGVNESLISYSILKELQNGAFYRKERDIVRQFNLSIIEDRAVDFYEMFYTVFKQIGFKPAAWRLSTEDTYWWVVYARFDGQLPAASHGTPGYSQINIRLREVL